jgi:hypothetical protein
MESPARTPASRRIAAISGDGGTAKWMASGVLKTSKVPIDGRKPELGFSA